ncbi:MAG: hypothetical protein RI922_2900 [Bacteroidota bacterium]|jgi:hypothetical protein
MESFVRRLKYYGIGFGIGLIFVFVFFQNRGCSWLPSNRVKNSFLDRLIVVPVGEMDVLKAKGLTEKDLVQVLNDGEVNFTESKKEGNPQVYSMEKDFKGKGKLKFYFSLPKESFISEIHFSEKSAKDVDNTTEGLGEIIHFPKDNDLVYVDSQSLLKKAELKDTKQILRLIKLNGMIDFKATNLKATPKAEHLIIFKDSKGRRIGARAVWYKNKIDISSFEFVN